MTQSSQGSDQDTPVTPEQTQSPEQTISEKKLARKAKDRHIEEMLDEASRDSFPASDPPAWISRKPAPLPKK